MPDGWHVDILSFRQARWQVPRSAVPWTHISDISHFPLHQLVTGAVLQKVASQFSLFVSIYITFPIDNKITPVEINPTDFCKRICPNKAAKLVPAV